MPLLYHFQLRVPVLHKTLFDYLRKEMHHFIKDQWRGNAIIGELIFDTVQSAIVCLLGLHHGCVKKCDAF